VESTRPFPRFGVLQGGLLRAGLTLEGVSQVQAGIHVAELVRFEDDEIRLSYEGNEADDANRRRVAGLVYGHVRWMSEFGLSAQVYATHRRTPASWDQLDTLEVVAQLQYESPKWFPVRRDRD